MQSTGQRAPVLPEQIALRDAAIPILSDRACRKRPQIVDAARMGTAVAVHGIRVDRRAVTYLVDANILSEPTKSSPNGRVVQWLRHHERDIVVDPVILGEVRSGILLLPKGKRRARLERWFDAGVQRLHCLPWEAETGLRWAELLARLRTSGRAMPIKDSLIAATALVHGLFVATRNRSNFEKAGVKIVDPSAAG